MKRLAFLLLIIMILFVLPCSFASDNSTFDDSSILTSNDIYFNASVENDGIGSFESPYRYFSSDRILNNSVIYVADGEYFLDNPITIKNITIIGQSCQKTIISGNSLYSNGFLSISSLTLNNLSINNHNSLNVNNVIFENNYCNESGGAINIGLGSLDVLIENSKFINNTANRGGAIYVNSDTSKVIIYNSTFINNTANRGGAILVSASILTLINNSFFINNSISVHTNVYTTGYSTILNGQYAFGVASYNGNSVFTINDTSFYMISSNFSSNKSASAGEAFYMVFDRDVSVNKVNTYFKFTGYNLFNNFKVNEVLFSIFTSIEHGPVILSLDNIIVSDSFIFNRILSLLNLNGIDINEVFGSYFVNYLIFEGFESNNIVMPSDEFIFYYNLIDLLKLTFISQLDLNNSYELSNNTLNIHLSGLDDFNIAINNHNIIFNEKGSNVFTVNDSYSLISKLPLLVDVNEDGVGISFVNFANSSFENSSFELALNDCDILNINTSNHSINIGNMANVTLSNFNYINFNFNF